MSLPVRWILPALAVAVVAALLVLGARARPDSPADRARDTLQEFARRADTSRIYAAAWFDCRRAAEGLAADRRDAACAGPQQRRDDALRALESPLAEIRQACARDVRKLADDLAQRLHDAQQQPRAGREALQRARDAFMEANARGAAASCTR